MRETCVRVLAATLMTAAIATVVGMSALLGTTREARGPIAAPPSSLQSTVRLTAHVTPPRRQTRPHHARLVTRDTIVAQPRRASVTRRLVVVHKRPVRHPAPARELAATTTTTATTATTATPPPAESAPAPTAAPEAQPDDQGPGNGHGRGHAYGHDKQDD